MQIGRYWSAKYGEGHLMDEAFAWGPYSKIQLQMNSEDGTV